MGTIHLPLLDGSSDLRVLARARLYAHARAAKMKVKHKEPIPG